MSDIERHKIIEFPTHSKCQRRSLAGTARSDVLMDVVLSSVFMLSHLNVTAWLKDKMKTKHSPIFGIGSSEIHFIKSNWT